VTNPAAVEDADLNKCRKAQNKTSANRVLEETRRIGFSDPRQFVDASGNLQPITGWTAEMGAAVSKLEVVKKNAAAGDGHTDTVVKIWFWNKTQALELLSKHLGLLKGADEDDRPAVPVFLVDRRVRTETLAVPFTSRVGAVPGCART
jgi:hypothetical protein